MSRHNSVDLDSPDRPFDNIINFRDVGRSVNQFCRKEWATRLDVEVSKYKTNHLT